MCELSEKRSKHSELDRRLPSVEKEGLDQYAPNFLPLRILIPFMSLLIASLRRNSLSAFRSYPGPKHLTRGDAVQFRQLFFSFPFTAPFVQLYPG